MTLSKTGLSLKVTGLFSLKYILYLKVSSSDARQNLMRKTFFNEEDFYGHK